MRKKKINNLIIVITTVLLISSVVLFSQGCKAPELLFGELLISENIDSATGAPINPKNEFDIELKGIWSTIEVTNVKGEDNYRFKYINKDTGEIISDFTGKYSEIFGEEEGYFEGICVDHFYQTEQEYLFLEPGNYEVEFYHQGELIGSAPLKIKTPDIEIVEVTLSKEINEKYEPLEPINEFEPDESIYACVKLDCTVKENILAAKWYFEEGEPLYEEEMEFPDNIYEPVNYAFFITPEEDDVLLPGNYYVEIYLNNSLYARYDFLVGKEVAVNIVDFNLNEDIDYMPTGEINNIFGEILYKVEFSPWSYVLESPIEGKWQALAIYIHSYYPVIKYSNYPSLILWCSGDLFWDTGEDVISLDRKENPHTIVEVAGIGKIYNIKKFDRNFIIRIDQCSIDWNWENYWFDNIIVSIALE
jgi:hypothetical protein